MESDSHEGLIKLLLVAGPALLLCVVCVCLVLHMSSRNELSSVCDGVRGMYKHFSG